MSFLLQYCAQLIRVLPNWLISIDIAKFDNSIHLYVNSDNILNVIHFLRDHQSTQCKGFVDLCCSDYPSKTNRFNLVYQLLSFKYNTRIYIHTEIPETTAISSVTSIFNSANWFEREVWDLFGVYFKEHPDLRRILTDYGFEGHPLRKDFPLSGYLEVRYDIEKKRVVHEPVEFAQEYRVFDFASPWNR